MMTDEFIQCLVFTKYSTDRNSRNSFSPFHLMFIKAICCYSKGLDDRVMWKTIAIKVSCRVEIASCKNCEKKNLLYLFIIVNNFKVVCGNFELTYVRCIFFLDFGKILALQFLHHPANCKANILTLLLFHEASSRWQKQMSTHSESTLQNPNKTVPFGC